MGGDFPGPYGTKYHPWAEEMHDTTATFNYAMKGAQLGVTEVAINLALYQVIQRGRDVLYVLPTAINAGDFSKSRFKPALDNSPQIAAAFTDTNTVNLKQAGSTNLYIRGSRGDSNLKSIPASRLILDELDEMDQKQIWLALERLSGQLEKQVWGVSTPTIPNFGIHKLFLTSTQEHYHFRCPGCGRWTRLSWPECIEIRGESVHDVRCHDSFLKCRECGVKLPHKAKPEWLAGAEWVSEHTAANPDIRGFHISQLYSFTVTPGELVVAYFRGFGDELAAKEFHNSKLGLPYIGDGAKVDDKHLDASIGTHSIEGDRPEVSGRLITMGVDQGKWSYVVVREWFIKEYTNDLNAAARCRQIWNGKFYETDWDRLDDLMREWQVLACVIDADPEISQARRFARRFPGFVWLCRYRKGQVAKEISVADNDDDAPIATVDRANWLSVSLGRFKTEPPTIELPRDVNEEFRTHQKNLVATYVRDGENVRLDYVTTGPDHYAHAGNYAEIALPLCAARDTNQDIASFL